MNQVIIKGKLGKAPETKTSQGGMSICSFSVATNDGKKKKTNWHQCTAFGKVAEVIQQYFRKGDDILVSGSIDYNKHEDKIYTSILVNTFEFCSGRKENNQQQPQRQNQQQWSGPQGKDDDIPW